MPRSTAARRPRVPRFTARTRALSSRGSHPRWLVQGTLVALLAWAVLMLAGSAARAETDRSFTFRSDTLTVANLIGSVEIIQSTGRDFVVDARVRGADADRVGVEFDSVDGSRARLLVEFPVDRHRRYVYPEHRGRTTLSSDYNRDGGSVLSRILSAITGGDLEVRGSGSGVEMWVDLTIRVPREGTLDLENGVGDIAASSLTGDLTVRSRSGALTGSGLQGDNVFDLGSGRVQLHRLAGDLVVDTGSGSVTLDDFDGRSLRIDTGSGQVTVTKARTRRFEVDTGSGSVRADDVSTEQATIDTGSGAVRLALTDMGRGDFLIDTGSGGITLLVPEYASATVVAETGSGGIDVGLADVRVLRRERNEMKFEVGGGQARVVLDTGSGGIRVLAADR